MATTVQEQITREAPEIEAYRLGLMDVAKQRAEIPVDLPTIRAAELTPQQIEALQMAGQGVGSYAPYMQSAGQAYTSAAEGYGGLPMYGLESLRAVGDAAGRAQDIGDRGLEAVSESVDLARGIGAYGMDSVSGASDLAASLAVGGAQAYDPQSVSAYMNPYQQQVTRNALDEMNRQATIQQQTLSAQAVKAGAFGGSREGVQRAELGRNLADVQSKKIFEDYFSNYSQAQTSAMNAFQNQQTRQQQAGTAVLGAGQAVGGQAANAAGQTIAGGQALGGQATNLAGQTIAGGQALGSSAISAGNLQGSSAAGIASLGQQTAALGQLQSGLQQGDTSFLYNIGAQQQAQRQKEIDAANQTQLQQQYEPFQRLSFLSDIYRGAPSSQQTLSQTTAPNPSLVSQVAGATTAGLAAYNLYGRQT
jgi:hypothetical protein